jgi:uncharacterized membrane protein YgcG
MKLCRIGRDVRPVKPVFRLVGGFIVLTAGLAGPTCYPYQYPGTYYCDETNNCADLPPLVCHTDINECLCPNVEDWYCLKHRKCMPVDECFPEAGAPCVDGGGGKGGEGGGGSQGGGGGSEGGAGGG